MGSELSDVSKLLSEWGSVKREGQPLLEELCNTVLMRTYVDAYDREATWGRLAGDGMHRCIGLKVEAKIAALHRTLTALHQEMHQLIVEVQSIADALEAALCSSGLTEAAHGNEVQVIAVRGGYELRDAARVVRAAAVMLEKELELTGAVLQDSILCSDRNTLTLYTAAWMMQPFMDQQVLKDLTAMAPSTSEVTALP
ncbi:unnamed protein product [Chrysoparadoxa australica]